MDKGCLQPETRPDRKLSETAILFAGCASRAGDVWLEHSRHHREASVDLIPANAVASTGTLAVPLDARDWIETRKTTLAAAISAAGEAARRGTCRTAPSRTARFASTNSSGPRLRAPMT